MSRRFWNKKGFPTELYRQYTWKKFNGEKWYHPLRHENFRKLNFSDIPKCSPTKFFGTLRQKIFDWKSWYSVLLHKFFRYLTFETVWNIRWFLTKFFATVRQKNRGKTVICKKVSKIPNILNHRSRSQEIFAYCDTKNFERRTWFSVLMQKKIRYPNFFGSLMALPTKFFSTVSPKKSKQNRDTPLLSIKVFDVPKILKQKGIPYRAL